MKGSLDIHRTLLALDVPHEIIRLPRLILNADEIPEVLGLPPAACVAVRVFEADPGPTHRLIAVAVRAGDLPDIATLATTVAARVVRVATPAQINAATDFYAGLVAPVCLPEDLPLYADLPLTEREVLYAPTGEGGTVVGVRSHDLLKVSNAKVVALHGRVHQPGRDDADLAPTHRHPMR